MLLKKFIINEIRRFDYKKYKCDTLIKLAAEGDHYIHMSDYNKVSINPHTWNRNSINGIYAQPLTPDIAKELCGALHPEHNPNAEWGPPIHFPRLKYIHVLKAKPDITWLPHNEKYIKPYKGYEYDAIYSGMSLSSGAPDVRAVGLYDEVIFLNNNAFDRVITLLNRTQNPDSTILRDPNVLH